MKDFFLAQTYAKIQRNEDAFTILWELYYNGFSKSHFVLSRLAAVHHNQRGKIFYIVSTGLESLETVRKFVKSQEISPVFPKSLEKIRKKCFPLILVNRS